jgi:integrase
LKRTSDKVGSMHRKPRRLGPDVWVWRRRTLDAMGIERNSSLIVGPVTELPTEKHAWASLEQRQSMLERGLTLSDLVERYKAESLDVRHSTRASYLSRLNCHIIPHWGDQAIANIKPLEVERRIHSLLVSKKTKSHIKSQLHRLFEFAMKCELIEFQRNPMLSVEIRGFRQRVRKKQVLTPEQFQTLLCNADLRLQTMMTLACSLGLRPSEFLGLQWPDLDVSRGVLMVSRSITGQHIEATKTPDSEDEIALDPDVLALLLRWKEQCADSSEQWLFPNLDTGRPFHADSLRDDHLHPAGQTIGIPNLGWYAFRHTYRTLLDDLGTPIGVQQKLMRHSDVRTTMNHYGSAYEKTKRRANTLVAGKLLPESMKAASRTTIH